MSWTISVALRVPSALGVKPIAIVQLAKCASPVGGQVVAPVAATSDGLFEVTLPMNSKFVPVFTTVRFLVAVSPTGEEPSASEAGTEIEVVGVAVEVAVGVAVAVLVAVAVAVAVRVVVAVVVGVPVVVAVAVGVPVAVAVGVTVAVMVAVGETVAVAVAV